MSISRHTSTWRVLTMTCASTGFVRSKSSVPSRTPSISRSMLGRTTRLTSPPTIWNTPTSAISSSCRQPPSSSV
jgi:hypothetical protein